jgi:low affinity Fe/Cu permease
MKVFPPGSDVRPLSGGGSPGIQEWLAAVATRWAGSPWAFASAVTLLLAWAASGPLLGFSQTWQLIVNTATTIVTFLMVFLIQRSQNKDSRAVHLKLNELLAAVEGASNRLLNLEDYSEDQLSTLHRHYDELARLSHEQGELTDSHSIEEAQRRHEAKHSDRS